MLLAEQGKIADPEVPGRMHYYAAGLQALAENRNEDALASFREVQRCPRTIQEIDLLEDCLGDAYLKLGRLEEAIAEYRRVLSSLLSEPIVHFHLAQAYERKGLRQQSKAEYQSFLNIWSQADERLPELIAAKASLRTLQ